MLEVAGGILIAWAVMCLLGVTVLFIIGHYS